MKQIKIVYTGEKKEKTTDKIVCTLFALKSRRKQTTVAVDKFITYLKREYLRILLSSDLELDESNELVRPFKLIRMYTGNTITRRTFVIYSNQIVFMRARGNIFNQLEL